MKYLELKKRAFMGITNKIKGFVRAVSGVVPLTLLNMADNDSLINYTLSGQAYQEKASTPEEQIEVEFVGDLVEDSTDINYGRYKIPIKCSGENGEVEFTNIYLDAPLRKIAEYTDYIDFEGQKLVRNIQKAILDTVWGRTGGLNSVNTYPFYIANASLKDASPDNDKVYILSDGLKGVSYNHFYNTDEECISGKSNDSKEIDIRLSKEKIGGATASLAQAYLKEHPMYIYYCLATPKETDIVLPKLQTFRGKTIYSVETTIKPSNMSAIYYSSVKGE